MLTQEVEMRISTIGLMVTLTLGLLALPLLAGAQQARKMYRIGFLRHAAGPNVKWHMKARRGELAA